MKKPTAKEITLGHSETFLAEIGPKVRAELAVLWAAQSSRRFIPAQW